MAAILAEARGSTPRRIERRMLYLDTLDWRLYRKEARLAIAWEGASQVVLWRPRGEGSYTRRALLRVPEFAWDLPFPDLRDEVEDIAGARRLLPVAEARLAGRLARVLDGREKTVAEVVYERATVSRPDASGAARKLAPSLRIVPLLGYAGPFEDLVSKIDRIDGVVRDEACLLERALRALAITPEDPEPERSWRLLPAMRADEAMKAIFRVLFETLRYHEPGTRQNLDSEFLHDYRVAVRRTRSGLGQVPGVFPRRIVRRFKRGFSWLGERTGPLRDLDVYLLTLPRYREGLGAELAPALDPLERELLARHLSEHRKLVAAFDSRRYRTLCSAWSEFLAAPVPLRTTLPNASLSIVAVAGERIQKAHARVLRRGDRIDAESPASDLHRLRIECKKLRYLLEFFAGLYAEQEIGRVVAALKALQNNLGEHQDLTIQREWLVGFEARLALTSPPRVREAVSGLMMRIDELKAEKRAEFPPRFAAFRALDVATVLGALAGEPCA